MLEKPELNEVQRAALDAQFASLPDKLVDRINMLQEMSLCFRKRMAHELEPMLNEHLKMIGGESLNERRATASWVNRVLDDLGLCVTVEGQPALFIAVLPDSRQPTTGRYDVLAHKGGCFTRTAKSQESLHLTLDAAPQGIEEILRKLRRVVSQGRSCEA